MSPNLIPDAIPGLVKFIYSLSQLTSAEGAGCTCRTLWAAVDRSLHLVGRGSKQETSNEMLTDSVSLWGQARGGWD